MNQYKTERVLCSLYSLISILIGITVICITVPYIHWRSTLDVCPGSWLENTNCGCILYGISASQYFNGGHNSYCLYAVFALLPILVYALVLAIFHMYRVCISNVGKYEDKNSTMVEEIEGEAIIVSSKSRVSQGNDPIIYCWIPTSCIAAIFCVYSMVYSGIVTQGMFRTCNQYRISLARELRATGDHVSVINFRLNCQAIFDFMDYLQKDPPNSRRGDFINTGVALQLAIITSWLSVVLWIVILILTARRAYSERDVLACCGN